MNTDDAATDRLARDNALLLQKLDLLERKLDAVLRHAEPIPPAASPAPVPPSITPRQLDVLRLVAQGHSNRQIGDELCLTEGSVKNALLHISHRLDARSRWHAVVIATSWGLLG